MFFKYTIFQIAAFMVFVLPLSGQKKKSTHKIVSVGFYNLENLFDTEDDPKIDDAEFLPSGARAWTQERYSEKLANMAQVIAQIGQPEVSAGLSILGVSEIENRRVLEDLVKQVPLRDRKYRIIHYDSPDGRGVDVGLLYNPMHFTPVFSKPIPLINYEGDRRRFTRDILYVKGMLDEDTLHVLVNHWPSRGGGPASVAYRNNGAKLCRMVVDSLFKIDKEAKILIMGDLNDDPTDESIKSYLRAVGRADEVSKTGLFNPYEDMFRRGQGSNAYRDAWSLFDQVILSEGITKPEAKGFRFLKATIFNKKFLIQKNGQYKGYPFRTFSGDQYQGGYSDHFPSYVYLVNDTETKQ
jgi:hypothetical protein